jgi:hypothetical protein
VHDNISNEELIEKLDALIKGNWKYKCEYCGKTFKTSQYKYQHKQRCKEKLVECEKDDFTQLKNEVKMLREHIINNPLSNGKTMHNNTNTNKNNQNSNNNNNNSNNVVNQVVINVKSFGQENLSYIEKDKDFLTSCLMSRDIKSLIENIHCDKNHPENHNVRIKSTKQELMETFVDGGWIISDQEETLDELMNKGYRVLKFHSHRNKNDIKAECDDDDDEYDSLMNWLENVYDDKKVRKPIKRQLLILFMNKRTMLLEKEIE